MAKKNISKLKKKLFTGAGLLQTIGIVLVVLLISLYYFSSYNNQAKIKNTQVQAANCDLGLEHPAGCGGFSGASGESECYSHAGSGCQWNLPPAPEPHWLGSCSCNPNHGLPPTPGETGKANITCSVGAGSVTFKNTGDAVGSKSVGGMWCQHHDDTKAECEQRGCNNGGSFTKDSGNLAPGQSVTVSVGSPSCGGWQIDTNECGSTSGCAWGDNCSVPTATPTPAPTSTPTNTPTPTTPIINPTNTPTPTGIITITPTYTPTPTPTNSLPNCGEICTTNWNGSLQSNGECPSDAQTCWAFGINEWRCVRNPDWSDHGCTSPGATVTPTPTLTPTPVRNQGCNESCDVNNNQCNSDAPYCIDYEGDGRGYICGKQTIAGAGPKCETPNPGCGEICDVNNNKCNSDAPYCIDYTNDGRGPICGRTNLAGEGDPKCLILTATPTKPIILGSTSPNVMPKAGADTNLTMGLMEIGLAGILLRAALLFL